MIPSFTTPHIPAASPSTSAFITWQVEVPITAVSIPGAVACAAGGVTWASTLPTATAMPSGRPVHCAACAVRPPARSPSLAIGWASLSWAKDANPGCSAAR